MKKETAKVGEIRYQNFRGIGEKHKPQHFFIWVYYLESCY